MLNRFSQVGTTFLVVLILVGYAQAQYLVSSKAGFVNKIEGKANIRQAGVSIEEAAQAALGSQMNEGDRLAVGADSYAEILLVPGSYMRLDQKTEIEAVRTALDQSRFDVVQGSVIIEVGEIEKNTPLEIGTPRTVVSVNRSGIYRIDVKGMDVVVSVREGEAYLGTRAQLFAKSATKIGRNKMVQLVGDGAPVNGKLKEKIFDRFDEWSYLRSEALVAANYSVLGRARSRGALLSGWMYDPFTNGYTFIPSSWLFVNPYGLGFFRRFSDCRMCWGYPNEWGGYNLGYGGNSIAQNPGARTVAPRATDTDRVTGRDQTSRTDVTTRRVEPYARPSYAPSRSIEPDSSFGASRGGFDRGSSPVYASPAVVAPAPSRVDAGSVSRGGDVGGGRSAGGRGSQ